MSDVDISTRTKQTPHNKMRSQTTPHKTTKSTKKKHKKKL